MSNLVKDKECETKNEIVTQPEKSSRELLDLLEETNQELQELYMQMTESEAPEVFTDDVNSRIRSLKRASGNLMKAYQQTALIKDELHARHKDLSKKKRIRLFPKAPANAVIDLQESRSDHFAKGMNIYKVLLICYIGSFVGVILEMAWWLMKKGVIESRAGLVYGPVNLLYGIGAVVMTLALYKFRNKGAWLSFIGGFLAGTIVEYVCSWGQEFFFGTQSWDYSLKPFNINGRVCLIYSVFWGILGVVWMKSVYPWLAKFILKIPQKFGKILTWVLCVFFSVNSVMTVISVYRWSQREAVPQPENAFWEFIDERFPDERMEKIFPNMKAVDS